MIQILYAQDHLARGQALAQAVPNAHHDVVTKVPIAKPGLDTLLFWGHGTIAALCNKSPDQLVTLVKNWKKLNSTLKTVEIITCNSRHAPTGHDAFAKRVKDGLHSGFRSSIRNIAVKALPVNVGGSLNAFSILLAHAPNKSWCYVTGPKYTGPGGSSMDDKIMSDGSETVKAESANLGYDLARAGDKVARDVKDREFTLNYGYFNTLRAHLGEVR